MALRLRLDERALLAPILFAACGSGGNALGPDAPAARTDAAVRADAARAPDASKAALCTDRFGTALTSSFGRLDGKVLAVVAPVDQQCPRPNNDHLILEITMGGAAYRMVVNVQSDRAGADTRVHTAEVTAPLSGEPFADGWHPGAKLDYVTTLSVHADAFAPHALSELVQTVSDRITIGAPVSVFATSSGGDSAHLVHRNGNGNDGAIVLDPTGASPRWLLFRFVDQTF